MQKDQLKEKRVVYTYQSRNKYLGVNTSVPVEDVKNHLNKFKELEYVIDIEDAHALFEFMYNGLGLEGFFNKVAFLIEEEYYLYGLSLSTDFMAKLVGDYLLAKFVDLELQKKISDIESRLQKCEFDIEKKELLEEDESLSHSQYIRFNSIYQKGNQKPDNDLLEAFYEGYTSEKRKAPPMFYAGLTEEVFDQTLAGVVNYKFEKYIKKHLAELQTDNKEGIGEELVEMQLSRVPHRLVLLEMLGIIEFLQVKYGLVNSPTKTASLLAFILELNQTERKTFIPTVNKLLNSSTGTPKNDKSMNFVRAELQKIGIILP